MNLNKFSKSLYVRGIDWEYFDHKCKFPCFHNSAYTVSLDEVIVNGNLHGDLKDRLLKFIYLYKNRRG